MSVDGWSIWHVGGTEEVHTGFWWRDLRKTAHLEDLGVDENTILTDLNEVGLEGMEEIALAQQRDWNERL